MPTPYSIPETLAPLIISRWLNGQSAGQIVEWIHETNRRRKEPTVTSKSSIARFIERYASSAALGERVPVVRRCRKQAMFTLDALDDIADGYRQCLDESATLDGTRVSGQRFSSKLRSLNSIERLLFRRLKLAGVDGRTDISEEEKNPAIAQLDAEYRAEARREIEEEYGVPEPVEQPHRIDSESTLISREKEAVVCQPQRTDSAPDLEADIAALEKIVGAQAAPARNAPCPCGSGLKFKRCCADGNPKRRNESAVSVTA